MELENDIPPPPYSATDPSVITPDSSTVTSGDYSPTSTLRPTSSQSMRAPSFITLRGGYLQGIPFTEDPTIDHYFQDRAFVFDPNRELLVLHREITAETTRDDLSNPQFALERDISEQDWQTFINYILTELGTEVSSRRHRKILSPEEFYERQTKVEHLVGQWNEAFFQPRSIKFIAHYYYKPHGSIKDTSQLVQRRSSKSGRRRILVEDGHIAPPRLERYRSSLLDHPQSSVANGRDHTGPSIQPRHTRRRGADVRGDHQRHQQRPERTRGRHETRHDQHIHRDASISSNSSYSSISSISSGEMDEPTIGVVREAIANFRLDPMNDRHNRMAYHQLLQQVRDRQTECVRARETCRREIISTSKAQRKAIRDDLKSIRKDAKDIYKNVKQQRKAARDQVKAALKGAKQVEKNARTSTKTVDKANGKSISSGSASSSTAQTPGHITMEDSSRSCDNLSTHIPGSYPEQASYEEETKKQREELQHLIIELKELIRITKENADEDTMAITNPEKKALARAPYEQDVAAMEKQLHSAQARLSDLEVYSPDLPDQYRSRSSLPTTNQLGPPGFGIRIGQQGENLGRQIGSWSEQLGRNMEAWGIGFGRDMERWGVGLGREMERRGTEFGQSMSGQTRPSGRRQ